MTQRAYSKQPTANSQTVVLSCGDNEFLAVSCELSAVGLGER